MLIATRVDTLGARGCERRLNGVYVCYQLPEGYDFMKYNDLFIDVYAVGKDGTIWKEQKGLSTEDELVFKEVMPEEQNGMLYLRTKNKDSGNSYIQLKRIVYETFTCGVNAAQMRIYCLNTNERDCHYINLSPTPKREKRIEVTTQNWWTMTKAVNEALKATHIREDKRLDAEIIAEEAGFEALEKYDSRRNGSLFVFIKQNVEWRLTDFKRRYIKDNPFIDSADRIEDEGHTEIRNENRLV